MPHSMLCRAGAAVALALTLTAGATAHADGAFPDSFHVMLPSDKPNEIVIGTNFGVLVSADAGKSWQWVCEQEIAPCVRYYQMAPAPSDAILAVNPTGLVSLGADACGYTAAQGVTNVADAFIDPHDASHVLALANGSSDADAMQLALLSSSDGGKTFGQPLYVAPAGSVLNGVEIAASDSQTVYLTQLQTSPTAPTVLRSTAGGPFTPFDQSALGAVELRIAAVDAKDATKVYFRAIDAASGSDSLVISTDGGQTTHVAKALPSGYAMSAFFQRDDGTLLLAGLQYNAQGMVDCAGIKPYGTAAAANFQSTDGGQTWSPWSTTLHLRGLGERGGKLYAVADNFTDGFAVAVSSDGGTTWTPLLRYVDIEGPLTCTTVAETCAGPWQNQKIIFGIGDDAGTGSTQPPKKGGGCAFATAETGSLGLGLLMALATLGLLRRSRRA